MSKKNRNKRSVYARFSSMGIQMAIIIGGLTWLGNYLDQKQHHKTPLWTIVLSLTGVVAAMYLMFKEVKNLNDDSTDEEGDK